MMKRFVLLLLVCVAAPAAAQGPADVERAKTDLDRQHVRLDGPCGAARIANLVAWRLRPAYGLLLKPGGNRAVLRADGTCVDGDVTSEPGYATDYIVQRSTGGGFDLLGDGGGANTPQWSGPEDDDGTVARNFAQFREPIDPRGYYREDSAPPPAPFPPPGPTPVPLPAPAPLPSTDLSAVLNAIAVLDARIGGLSIQISQLQAQQREDTEAIRADIKSFRQAANDVVKNILKYVGPAVAGLLAGLAKN